MMPSILERAGLEAGAPAGVSPLSAAWPKTADFKSYWNWLVADGNQCPVWAGNEKQIGIYHE